MKQSHYTSPIAEMTILSDEEGIYLLEFEGRKNLQKDIEKLCTIKDATIVPGETMLSKMLKKELDLYFCGKLTEFKTPINVIGTPFQKKVWKTLQNIPYASTNSYLEEATLFGNPKAVRAVASANGKNRLAIIIPCHRVIRADGSLGGYGGGIERKRWLLEHEGRNL